MALGDGCDGGATLQKTHGKPSLLVKQRVVEAHDGWHSLAKVTEAMKHALE